MIYVFVEIVIMIDPDSTQPIDINTDDQNKKPPFKIATGEYFTWISSGITSVGNVRQINEDALLEYPEKMIWAVADGMGGHECGDIASKTTVDYLQTVEFDPELSIMVNNVEDRLLDANERLCDLGRENGQLAGSTVVVLIAHERHCAVLWAGDSRIYRYRNGQLEQITRDHSQVEEMVEMGKLTAEEAAVHPQVNIITRAVGAHPHLFLDMEILDVQDEDCFVLCSDGLNKEVTDDEICSIVSCLTPSQAAQKLIDLALERRGRDNVTVIVVRAQANM